MARKLAKDIVPGDRVKTWSTQKWFWLVEENLHEPGKMSWGTYDGTLLVRDTENGYGDAACYSNDEMLEVEE